MKPTHWADQIAQKIIAEKGEKELYVCAAGITPSGTVHIGNFREIITVDIVARALNDAGKKVRFIYSWDDYDVFRKVPANMPEQDMLKMHLRLPIVDVPDPFGTEENYARHNEVEVERNIAKVDIHPEYLYQSKKYRANEYAEQVRIALQNTKKIKKILNKYRKEPLAEDWLPIIGYCNKCRKDNVKFSDYDNEYEISMACDSCGECDVIDIRKTGFIKLPWRVDWPMRWAYEKVDFEPGGKDHSTVGGSFSTGKEIVEIYDWTAPTYAMYDFIRIKGSGGKISSSIGNVITLGDVLEVYEPEIVRWLFAGTRPGAEFAISFDVDVLQIYEDFDKCERIYYGEQKAKNEKEEAKQKRIYELSSVDRPQKKMRFQPSFRHLTSVLQIHHLDVEKTISFYTKQLKNIEDKNRLRSRAECARNWIEKHAPDDFRFQVRDSVPGNLGLTNSERGALQDLASALKQKSWTPEELHEEFYVLKEKHGLDTPGFFKAAYNVLIGKEKGPKLASFILEIGEHAIHLLENA